LPENGDATSEKNSQNGNFVGSPLGRVGLVKGDIFRWGWLWLHIAKWFGLDNRSPDA
jgi:hypothetical protein